MLGQRLGRASPPTTCLSWASHWPGDCAPYCLPTTARLPANASNRHHYRFAQLPLHAHWFARHPFGSSDSSSMPATTRHIAQLDHDSFIRPLVGFATTSALPSPFWLPLPARSLCRPHLRLTRCLRILPARIPPALLCSLVDLRSYCSPLPPCTAALPVEQPPRAYAHTLCRHVPHCYLPVPTPLLPPLPASPT